jgi:hypothetical protein
MRRDDEGGTMAKRSVSFRIDEGTHAAVAAAADASGATLSAHVRSVVSAAHAAPPEKIDMLAPNPDDLRPVLDAATDKNRAGIAAEDPLAYEGLGPQHHDPGFENVGGVRRHVFDGRGKR